MKPEYSQIPHHGFTTIYGSSSSFTQYLDDIMDQYPEGRISYLTATPAETYIQIRDGFQSRFHYQYIYTLQDLIETVKYDRSALLLIQYHPIWIIHTGTGELESCTQLLRERAKWYGPVVLLTTTQERNILQIQKTADNSLQLQQLIDRGKSSREYVLKRYQIKGFPDKSRYLHNFEEQQKLMV